MSNLNPDEFGHESPVSHFGMKPIPAWQEAEYRKFHGEERVDQTLRLPTSKLRGGQNMVDTARVHSIASSGPNNPDQAESWHVQATGLPDGNYMITDGHHRVAASVLRGEQFHDVHVRTQYKPRNKMPWEA